MRTKAFFGTTRTLMLSAKKRYASFFMFNAKAKLSGAF